MGKKRHCRASDVQWSSSTSGHWKSSIATTVHITSTVVGMRIIAVRRHNICAVPYSPKAQKCPKAKKMLQYIQVITCSLFKRGAVAQCAYAWLWMSNIGHSNLAWVTSPPLPHFSPPSLPAWSSLFYHEEYKSLLIINLNNLLVFTRFKMKLS